MSFPLGIAQAIQTNVAGTGAVTIVPASGDNDVYRDLVTLVITTTNAAAATVTIKSGATTLVVLNYPNAASAPSTPFVLDFCDVPLSQPAANNAWTATASVNASGFNVTAQFIERQ